MRVACSLRDHPSLSSNAPICRLPSPCTRRLSWMPISCMIFWHVTLPTWGSDCRRYATRILPMTSSSALSRTSLKVRVPFLSCSRTCARLLLISWAFCSALRFSSSVSLGSATGFTSLPPSRREFAAMAKSLDILHLFANLFDFGLPFDDPSGQLGVVGLGADGVDLPVQLLKKEVQLPAGRGHPAHVQELGDVATRPGELLVDVGPLGEEGYLQRHAVFVHRELPQPLLHPFPKACPVVLHHLRRPFLHPLDNLLEFFQSMCDVGEQPLPFGSPHGRQPLQRLPQRLLHQGPDGVDVDFPLFDDEHVRKREDLVHLEIGVAAEELSRFPEGLSVTPEQPRIYPDRSLFGTKFLYRDENFHPSTLDVFGGDPPDPLLQGL